MNLVMSPFSNSPVRDWPAKSYCELIGLLLAWLPEYAAVRVIGTASQRARADAIVRPFDARRVVNECGRLGTPALRAMIAGADGVIGNNSGIAHLAATLGRPTICIFGGSHQRQEWRPLGRRTVVISRDVWCSPCHLDRLDRCWSGKACLVGIAAREVAAVVHDMLQRSQDGRTSSTLDL